MTSTVGTPAFYDPSRRSDSTQKSSRLGEYGPSQVGGSKDQSSLNMPAIGPYSGGAWNGGGIWASKASTIGSGMKSNDTARSSARSQLTNGESPSTGGVDLSVLEASGEITGSGSLLPSSESDGWGRRNSAQWPSLGTAPFANGLANTRNGHGSTSPVRSRTNQHTRSNSPYHNNQIPAIGTQAAPKSQSLLDPTSRTFNSSGVFNSLQGTGLRQNGHDKGRNLDSVQLGSIGANGTHTYSGYASSAASRSGSLPPSRHGNEPSSAPQFGEFASSSLYQPGKAEMFSHRRNEPSMSSNFSTSGQNKGADSNWGPMNDISSSFNRMDMNRDAADNFQANWDNAYQVSSPTALNGSYGGFQRSGSVSYDQDARVAQSIQQPYNRFGNQLSFGDMSQSPGGLDARRNQESPLYSSNTPPLQEHHRAPSTASTRSGFSSNNYTNPVILDRKLRNLQEAQQFGNITANQAMAYRQNQQQFYPYAGNLTPAALARMNVGQPYYAHMNPMNMNPYQMNGLPQTHRQPPRGPAVDNQEASSLRSALMEEFRSSKGNRKYELKDIYNHVVEFSGDQHGSRFIQQKLETANSDEKAQLFSEILPNSYQLMTDVFGNYVCQKFFEHGNQTQKKQLADKMKGLVTELSLQMYGCRVVQKAFEHILTDQQAALVKELEPEILRCIKDQNGNHVVQKAIQRIAPEHITFINRAVSGNVYHLAAHSYGCRVIQRMLEFCPPATRNEVIDELHACALQLIVDQYGNYVIQNVMDHGRPEDRLKLIEFTIDQVLTYSRHKYASNVVEHCLRKGSDEHRTRIVDIVRSVDERGEPRMNQLVRDQYGNYVIQTIIKILEGDERRSFMEQVKGIVEKVRHFSYGKHIGQIEKLIEEKTRELAQQQGSVNTSASHTPPVTGGTSPQSTSQTSTANTSAVEDPVDSAASKDK